MVRADHQGSRRVGWKAAGLGDDERRAVVWGVAAGRPVMTDLVTPQKTFLSSKVEHFTESVIREMTRQAMLHGAVNLSQGFPDFPAPTEIKRAAQEAIAADVNQYEIGRAHV